jgi:hypothetical protein
MPSTQYRIGAPYYAVARHPEEKPYNRMHEDGLPQQLGFRGAFVLGVALYGYMTRALVASLGETWLGRAVIDVKFLRPVCPGDRIRMETTAVPGEGGQAFEVAMHNETSGNELSAQLKTSVPSPFPDVNATAGEKPDEWEGPVTQRRTWDNIVTGKAYRSLRLTLSAADNEFWTRALDDDLPVYHEGERAPLHPAHVLRLIQLGYTNQFIGESAVHSSSRAVIRRMLRIGDPVHVLTVPLEKWEKKQNHWLTIYCAIRSGEEVCAEVFHTQIIKLRGVESAAAGERTGR